MWRRAGRAQCPASPSGDVCWGGGEGGTSQCPGPLLLLCVPHPQHPISASLSISLLCSLPILVGMGPGLGSACCEPFLGLGRAGQGAAQVQSQCRAIQGLGALASLHREQVAREGQVHKSPTAFGCLEPFLLLPIPLQSPQTPASAEYAPLLHRGKGPQGGGLSQLPNTHHPSWWTWTPPLPASSGPLTPNSLQPRLLLSWLL